VTVEIPLTKGFVAIVDAEDAGRVLAMGRWYARRSLRTTYASKKVRLDDGREVGVHMHNFITGWPYVDHRNGDGLDNRRANLRQATHVENGRNRGAQVNNTSGWKGVSWDTGRGRWRAQIAVDGRRIFLGRFDDPVEAARVYDEAAVRYFGEFAHLNFPDTSLSDVRRRGLAVRTEDRRVGQRVHLAVVNEEP
jgi:hypothetical protein